MGMKSSQPFNVKALPSQCFYNDEKEDEENYILNNFSEKGSAKSDPNLFQLSTNKPQYSTNLIPGNIPALIRIGQESREPSMYNFSSNDSQECETEDFKVSPAMKKCFSVEDLESLKPSRRSTSSSKSRRRTRSDDSDIGMPDDEENEINVVFSVEHIPNEELLKITAHGLYDIPRKSTARLFFVIVTLIPNYDDNEKRSKCATYSDNFVKFEEDFVFSKVPHDKLDTYTIRISVYSKKRAKGPGRPYFIGELFTNCSDIAWTPVGHTTIVKPAPRKRLKKVYTLVILFIIINSSPVSNTRYFHYTRASQ